MALPGISNANEYYSAHYFESVLAGDIKKVRERWTEQAKAQLEADLAAGLSNATASTPEAQFKALRKPWQQMREAEIGIADEPAERLRLQRELFFQPLLEALGYPFAPHAEPVLIGGEAYQVPLLGEVSNAKGEPWLWVVECFNPSDEPADPLELTVATRWGCQIDAPSLGTVLTDGDGQGDVVAHEPQALEEGSTLRRLWKAHQAVAGTAPAPVADIPPAVAVALPLGKEIEGCRLTAYPDPETGAEPWTIGWGSTSYVDGAPVNQGDRISQELAHALLAGRLERDCHLLAQRIPSW